MKTDNPAAKLTRWLSAVAIVTLGIALWVHRQALEQTVAQFDAAAAAAARATAADRLMAREFPPVALKNPGGSAVDLQDAVRGRLVWIVRAGECTDCMTNMSTWNGYAGGADTAGLLIVAGADSERARALVNEAGIRGPVLADPDGELQRHFGRLLPSSYALVDHSGIIRMTDSQWSSRAGTGTAKAARPFSTARRQSTPRSTQLFAAATLRPLHLAGNLPPISPACAAPHLATAAPRCYPFSLISKQKKFGADPPPLLRSIQCL